MSDDRDRPAPPRTRPGPGYIACCIAAGLILVASGFAWVTVRTVDGIASSDAIASGPSTGPQNILLMGIESRRYWNGDILPPSILAKLHAGSAQAVANGVGGNDTNTLILIHIFADGRKAVGFSIPRDDWVNFSDTIGPQQVGKIDQAYGVSMFFREQQVVAHHPDMSQISQYAPPASRVLRRKRSAWLHCEHGK